MTATAVPVETNEVDPASRERVAEMVTEFLDARCPLNYTWTYKSSRHDLRALYEKAKGEQWDGRTYLPWDAHVDPTEEQVPDHTIAIYGTHLWNKLDKKHIGELRQHMQSWTLSNFMHGEQGALLATAQIVTTVPWADAKFYAATQVIDEARHVEVYERYLREKIQLTYDINEHLRSLLDQILSDPRWDMKYLGMQILVEGLALAAFKFMHTFTREPLIKELTHMVMRDEARHVAFGVLSLREHYATGLNEKERREREEFTYEACRLMRDRFLATEVWRNLGFPLAECTELALCSATMLEFRRLLFMRIVPNIKRLGLLTPFLRERFTELGILQFEDMPADA
jgi:P-aminobenzoate N-oxygenase AurF